MIMFLKLILSCTSKYENYIFTYIQILNFFIGNNNMESLLKNQVNLDPTLNRQNPTRKRAELKTIRVDQTKTQPITTRIFVQIRCDPNHGRVWSWHTRSTRPFYAVPQYPLTSSYLGSEHCLLLVRGKRMDATPTHL